MPWKDALKPKPLKAYLPASPFIANDTFDVGGLDADDDRRRTVSVQNPLESDKANPHTSNVSLARNGEGRTSA